MFLLLDIDGVLIPASSWKSQTTLGDGFPCFNIKNIESFNAILAKTSPSVVLMSSHRDRFSNLEWTNIFRSRGINIEITKFEIPFKPKQSRLELVLTWLENNKDKNNYVIIDDDKSLNDLPSDAKNRLILTSPLVGLDFDQAKVVVEKLSSPKGFPEKKYAL